MATHRKKIRVTFSEILNSVGEENASRLMQKARNFSYLAKASNSKKQSNIAYDWKNRCLKQLLHKCEKYTSVSYDNGSCRYKGLLLIHLNRNKYGLHTHPNWLNRN